MTTTVVQDDQQVGPEIAISSGMSPVPMQYDQLPLDQSARPVQESGTAFLEVSEQCISSLQGTPDLYDESASIGLPGNGNVVDRQLAAGDTHPLPRPAPSLQNLNNRFRRLNKRFSSSISSFSDSAKPIRHKRSASDNAAGAFMKSSKDVLKSNELNPIINFRHSAPNLQPSHGDSTRNKAPHALEPQRSNHGHLPSAEDSSRLGDQLYAVLQNDTMNRRLFVPRVDLDSVITQRSVGRELARWVYLPARISPTAWRTTTRLQIGSSSGHPSTKQSLVEQELLEGSECGSVQQIFAILLLIDRPTKIWSFLKEGICDADLPLRVKTPCTLQGTRNPTVHLKCLKKPRDVSSFVEKQWIVLVPVFEQSSSREISHVKADDKQSLPFVHWEQSGHVGRFGEIYRAQIHPVHCKFSRGVAPGDVVAVKRLHLDDPKAFEHESTILRRLLKEPLSHPHLITLLATFEQRRHQYLMFPWAECDLENYWKRDDHEKDERFPIWLVQQCQGIAEALSRIHRYDTTSATTIIYQKSDGTSTIKPIAVKARMDDPTKPRNDLTLSGRHGDIRPQNILWYRDPSVAQDIGTLKLSDFGSARFRDITGTPEEKRKSMAISWTYLSPECQMPDANPSIQCDVWALGCVFLEFICWHHTGYGGLKRFEHQRNLGYDSDSFFTIVRDEKTERRVMRDGKAERRPECYAKVKETVIDEIAELRELSSSDRGLADLLDSIRNNMLVVQNDGLGTVREVDGDENSTTHAYLAVQPQPHRRMSSGNIARNLGETLQQLEPSRRSSSEST